VKEQIGGYGVPQLVTGLVASAVVSPIYVAVTNPISRLEVIMQTSKIDGKGVSTMAAVKEIVQDSKDFGMKGAFRGNGIGIAKAVISLTLFHEGRMGLMEWNKNRNIAAGLVPAAAEEKLGKKA